MPEQALYLKWRPLSFPDVVGQEHITRTLRNSIKTGRIRHAYLFSGPRGTGKTTTARLLAKAVNCVDENLDNRPCNQCPTCMAMNEGRFLDLIEIDAASHTGVDDVRDLRDKIAFAPGEGRYKVYIIDEVHRFSGNAFDALLKTLEEPPEHALFILATTEIDKVPATIKSRCLPFEFRRLSMREVTERLELIAEEEGLHIDHAALELVAREGTGSVRDSISLLDQIVADPAEVISLELTQRILGTASARAVRELIDALLQKQVARGLHIINQAIDAGSDPHQYGQQIVEHLRAIMLAQTASADLLQVSQDDQALFAQQATLISRGELLRTIRIFNDVVSKDTGGWQPQLALELALIESLQEPEALPMMPQRTMGIPQANTTKQTETANTGADDYQRAEPSKPGSPAVISPSLVQEKWLEAQTLIFRNTNNTNKDTTALVVNLPNLMDHAKVVGVDGNTVIMGVSQQLYLGKLNETTRIKWVERAISNVANIQLRIKYVLLDESDSGVFSPSPDVVDDPVIQEGLGLGGQIREGDE